MANRRMFSKDVIDSDRFLDMPPTAQNLYFHLGIQADDDGFVASPKKVKRTCSATDDDLKLLEAKEFIISFESGVIVITDWKLNNYIKKDRYNPTIHLKEKGNLTTTENNSYKRMKSEIVPSGTLMEPIRNQSGYHMEAQDRLGQDSIEQDRLGQCSLEQDRSVKGSRGEGSIEQGREQSRATHSFDACCSLYEKNFHKLTTLDKNSLSRLEEASGTDFLYIAIEKTIYKENVANPLGYITKLIQDWLSNGFTSIDDIEDEQQAFNAQYE